MEVSNPRRILAVSLSDSSNHLSRVIKELTGTAPEPTASGIAGITHPFDLKTAYYSASVPIWLDLIATPPEWSASFLSEEAREVLDVLGGIMIVFPLPVRPQSDEAKAARELIQHVGKVVKDGLGGWEWDGVGLCLGVGEVDDVEDWDECAAEWGLEFVQVRGKDSDGAKNEFGEKTGIPRVREALEANDWSQAGGALGSDLGDLDAPLEGDIDGLDAGGAPTGLDPDFDPESLDFGFEREDFEGLKQAIWKAGQEDKEDFLNGEPSTTATGSRDDKLDEEEIQKLEGMMRKLQAVRDMTAGLPEAQRKRVAAKAVGEVMKEL